MIKKLLLNFSPNTGTRHHAGCGAGGPQTVRGSALRCSRFNPAGATSLCAEHVRLLLLALPLTARTGTPRAPSADQLSYRGPPQPQMSKARKRVRWASPRKRRVRGRSKRAIRLAPMSHVVYHDLPYRYFNFITMR
jgi:hypothetical protein